MFYKRKQEAWENFEPKFITSNRDYSCYNQSINTRGFFKLKYTSQRYLIGLAEENLIKYYSYFDLRTIREYTFFFDTEEDITLFKLKYNI